MKLLDAFPLKKMVRYPDIMEGNLYSIFVE